VDFFGEEAVGAFGDGDFVGAGGGLAFFVEGHDDDGGAVAADEFGLLEEFFFAFFEGDGVDDAFALEALEAFFEDVPLGAVDLDGDAGDVRLGGDEVEEAAHAGAGVEHAFVEVDVDDVGAVGDLLAGDFDGFVEFVLLDEFAEARGDGDVGALADESEGGVGVVDVVWFQAAEAQAVEGRRNFARGEFFHGLADGGDVFGGGAAAAADDVEEAGGCEVFELAGGVFGEFVVAGGARGLGRPALG
jgi:hypothetical protein